MEKWRRRSIDLFASLAFGGSGEIEVVPYYPQKTLVSGAERPFFRRCLPEKKGISSKRLYSMLCELENERRANIHSVMVLKGGEVICECSAEGYSVNEWHISYSMAKTVCGMVIGRLISEGAVKTDELLVNIFPEIPYKDKRFPLITVDHLLSMTCGVDFSELGSVTEESWTEIFFSSSLKFVPGTKFFYNSMNSYILAGIAERVSGRSFGELAEEFIFAPLGIKNYLWEIGPEGREKGGWGLYLSPESWAKIGYMFLSGGRFRDKQILTPEWVRLSSEVKAAAPDNIGNFNYAYHMWVSRDNSEILFNGMLGQNLWICPKNDTIVVIMGGNNELFQDSPALEIIRGHLGGRINDRLRRGNFELLAEKQRTFFRGRSLARLSADKKRPVLRFFIKKWGFFDPELTRMLGLYRFGNNNASLLPLMIRGMQNNFGHSLDALRIGRDRDDIFLTFYSGGAEQSVPVGLCEYKEAAVDFRGEKYTVRSAAYLNRQASAEPELRVEILFPETASKRLIKIRKQKSDRITVDFSETPDHNILDRFLRHSLEENQALSFLVDVVERRFGKKAVSKILSKIFNPTLVGADESLPRWEMIIDEENKKSSDISGAAKLMLALVDKFFREHEEKKSK